jgi:hypothetical protein
MDTHTQEPERYGGGYGRPIREEPPRTITRAVLRVRYVRSMPILVRYVPTSMTRAQYDRVEQILQERGGPGGPPPALQFHFLFGDEPALQVSEVWESEEAWRQVWDGAVKGALSTAGVELPEPDRLPVHDIWGSGVNRE